MAAASPPAEKKKYTKTQLVNTIRVIDSVLVVLVCVMVGLFYHRYVIVPSRVAPPLPFPAEQHLEEFVPLDEDGNIEICEHFLSSDEIDQVLDLMKDQNDWQESPTGGIHYQVPTQSRWNNKLQHSSIIQIIEQRIATATNIPIHVNEDMLHLANITSHGTAIREGNYPPFGLHHDTDTRPWRHKTVLIYLTTVLDGSGKTIFPLSVPLNKAGIMNVKMGNFKKQLTKQLTNEDNNWNRQVTFPLDSKHKYMDLIEASCMGQIGVTIKPVAGTALMFDHLIDGNNDEPNVNIWHAGCNVVGANDQKIILQKFKEKKIQQRNNKRVQIESERTSIFNYNSYHNHNQKRKKPTKKKRKKK